MGHAWRVFVWCLGVLLLLLSVLTAFVGYVLPWGQMSFWGATVITSLASALPVVGYPLVWAGVRADSVHKVFSSTFETFPTRRGEDPFRIASVHAIGAGIHAIRAGRH